MFPADHLHTSVFSQLQDLFFIGRVEGWRRGLGPREASIAETKTHQKTTVSHREKRAQHHLVCSVTTPPPPPSPPPPPPPPAGPQTANIPKCNYGKPRRDDPTPGWLENLFTSSKESDFMMSSDWRELSSWTATALRSAGGSDSLALSRWEVSPYRCSSKTNFI